MNGQARFWDWMAARYSRQPIADEAAYREKLSRTQQFFDPECRVLEFGCGTGSTALAHAPYVGHIHATDISAEMIAIASDKARGEGVANVSFEVAALRDSSDGDAGWDVILGLNVLHLVPDMDGDIDLAYALLKPGGVFISSTPCVAEMSRAFRFIAPLFRWLPFLPSLTVFSREELESDLHKAGFVIETSWQPDSNKAIFIVARKPE